MIKFEQRLDTNIMQLNNNIGILKKDVERVEQEKNKIRDKEQATSSL